MTAQGLEIVSRAAQLFHERFGQPPQWGAGAIAPGRVNLIGEHTDYNQGLVLPIAINRHMVALATPSDTGDSTLYAADLDQTWRVDLTQPLRPNSALPSSFVNYILGVVHEFKCAGNDVPNMNVLITSDLPRGAGLSSSAALEIAVGMMLQQVVGVSFSALQLAQLCQRAEQQFVGVPCGIMDMYVIAAAREDHAMLLDCRSLEHEMIPLPRQTPTGELALLIVNTGVRRSLDDGRYAARRQACEAAAASLGLQSLRDATLDMIDRPTLPTELHNAALHVVSENERVQQAAKLLRAGRIDALGELLFASHASLRDVFGVSCTELNAVVDVAAQWSHGPGVWGARLTGAGFGGCAIILCDAHVVAQVSTAIEQRFNSDFGRSPTFMTVNATGGAASLNVSAISV